jgi:hypothetical protein
MAKENTGINEQNETEPERKKGVGAKGPEMRPGYNPGQPTEEESKQTITGKGLRMV